MSTRLEHVIPLSEGGTNDDDNLEGWCEDHANAKTQAEAARAKGDRAPRVTARINPDGWPDGT